MKIAAIRNSIRRIGYLLPFRLHLAVLLLILVWAASWLQKTNALPETSRTAIIALFISVTFWFTFSILIFSFVTALVPWLLFLLNKKNNVTSLDIQIPQGENSLSEKQDVVISIKKIIKPLFGYIRMRLIYDGHTISKKFLPVLKRNPSLFSSDVYGQYTWPITNVKEYDITSGVIYFEDFFQFFSFATQHAAKSKFFKAPPRFNSRELIVQPKRTEETNTRIEEIRKVEGEFLNYKNFEDNDDVRRIVWKIYAKNKELVVRIPETNDPYASHIYFYASFHNTLSGDLYENFNTIFLDYFKTVVWSNYEQLSRQNVLLQFIPDQQSKNYFADDVLQKVKYIISTASWQQNNDLVQYFNQANASVLCISSFNDAKQVAEILERSGRGLAVVFIELSNSFEKAKVTDWFQWLFIKPQGNSQEKLKLSYNLSPLKRKMIDNEKAIKNLLDKSDCEILIV
ncbi:MAG: DUF58 domain-containing protein [Ginsengibacter sp.]